MKYIIISIVAYVLISASCHAQTNEAQETSFPSLAHPAKPILIMDETTYQVINGRTACIVTWNKDIAEAFRKKYARCIVRSRTRHHGQAWVFYIRLSPAQRLVAIK